MYCTNCEKEINKSDNFCNYCGKANSKINENDNTFSMKYFDFFKTWYLGFIIIINLISIIGNITNLQDVQNIQLFIINIILYIALPIKLVCDLDKKSKFIFFLLMCFFILDYFFRILFGAIQCIVNNGETSFIIYLFILVLVYGIWYIPNFIYFIKRRSLFIN